MARQHRLTMRIPATDAAAALDRIRAQEDEYTPLRIDVGDDGQVTARGGPGSSLARSTRLRGRITDGDRGPVLHAVVRTSSAGMVWPWIMGILAVLVALGATAGVLFDGPTPGPLLIGLPGAAALGATSWFMRRQETESFRLDVATLTTEFEEMFTGPLLDLPED